MLRHLVQVDAFTNEPFRGNPAAVCLLPQAAPDEWMQLVAREMNLSETAFLHREAGAYRLRWFTPAIEVDLCGHATLASAHVLWEDGHLRPEDAARFLTKSGELSAVRRGEWIEMDFPTTPVRPSTVTANWQAVLGVTPVFAGETRFDAFVELATEEAVSTVVPDLAAIARLPYRGLIVTSRSSAPYDFVSRFFAPAVGIPEDPVTGSAHCALTPYWSRKLGRQRLRAYQASKRGGEIRVSDNRERVALAGQAITILRAELLA
jgi:PhzF family phenazine biosynthesis protein